MDRCTICEGDFSLEEEGGITGFIGILPCAFCPCCYAGLVDMMEQLHWDEEE
jgi:hypothetical protein